MRMSLTILSLFFGISFLIVGCSQGTRLEVIGETEETTYRRAEQFMRENRVNEALAAYLKVIDKRQREGAEAPESHLAVGQLYLEHVEDPIASIYHLREFLRLKPGSPQAEKVEGMVLTAKKKFAATLPGQPYHESIDRMDLLELLKQVREENLRLKNQLALANQRLQAAGQGGLQVATGADRADDPDFYTPPSQARQTELQEVRQAPATYTVERGDSLYRISTRVYGTGAHWRKILEANQDVLPTPKALKPGMVLRIPPTP